MRNFNNVSLVAFITLGDNLSLGMRADSALSKQYAQALSKCTESQLWDIPASSMRPNSGHPLESWLVSSGLGMSAEAGQRNKSGRGDAFIARDGNVLIVGGTSYQNEEMRKYILENPQRFLKRASSGTSGIKGTGKTQRITANSEWEALLPYQLLLNQRDVLNRVRASILEENGKVVETTLARREELKLELATVVAEEKVLGSSVSALIPLVKQGIIAQSVLDTTQVLLKNSIVRIEEWDIYTDRELGKLGSVSVAPTESKITQLEEALGVLEDFYRASENSKFEGIVQAILVAKAAKAVASTLTPDGVEIPF